MSRCIQSSLSNIKKKSSCHWAQLWRTGTSSLSGLQSWEITETGTAELMRPAKPNLRRDWVRTTKEWSAKLPGSNGLSTQHHPRTPKTCLLLSLTERTTLMKQGRMEGTTLHRWLSIKSNRNSSANGLSSLTRTISLQPCVSASKRTLEKVCK